MPPAVAHGWLYDGASAVRRAVGMRRAGDTLVLSVADSGTETLLPTDLIAADDLPEALVLYRRDRDGWRLSLARPIPADIEEVLPRGGHYGRWIDRIGLWPALAAGLALSLAVLASGFFLPRLAAPFVPRSVEKRYGDVLVGDFGGQYCAGPGGQAALDVLARKLAPQDRDFDIRVVNIPIVNAAALPGGHVVVFRQLLAEADGPDEVAGVLAHEIAHVEHRDVTEALIREMGFNLVISSLGGTTGGNIDAMLGTRYSRGAEHRADLGAVETLAKAGIDPRPTAAFFSRLANQEKRLGRFGDTIGYLSTHPMSASRRDLFAGAAQAHAIYAPALTRDQWQALADICRNAPFRGPRRIVRISRH